MEKRYDHADLNVNGTEDWDEMDAILGAPDVWECGQADETRQRTAWLTTELP